MTKPALTTSELKLIADAVRYLERPTLLMELANLAGKPVEVLLRAVNRIAPDKIDRIVNLSLRTALNLAVCTIPDRSPAVAKELEQDINCVTASGWKHKLSVAFTGGVGGLFGAAGLAAELPITTTVMFRSIASIAKEYGEDLGDVGTRLQCLTVLSFGAAPQENASQCAYLTARLGLQGTLTQATKIVSMLTAEELSSMIQKGTVPAIVKLIARIASQFNITVTQKTFVQALPLLGSATGALINVALIDHFNRVARFHFGIRSLERKYGLEPVQAIYRQTAQQLKQQHSAPGLAFETLPGI